MSRLIIFFGLFIALQDSYAEEWYQGGNLHGSTLSQWSTASEKNKLATSSDWIVVVLGENEVRNMILLKKKANILVNLVSIYSLEY